MPKLSGRKATAATLALEAGRLVFSHGQRIWNNLTPEERARLIVLLTPKDGKIFGIRTVSIRRPRIGLAREEGGRLPVRTGLSEEGKRLKIKVPVPRVRVIKHLSPEERDELKQLIKKANTVIG